MRNKIVGTYYMGWELVELVLREGTGGESHLVSGNLKGGKIVVGSEDSKWWGVVSILLHEALEYAFCRMRCRYITTEDLRIDPSGYLFSFDHQQFTEISARVAEFMAASLPDLEKAWKQERKKRSV